jgi:hypothetical protein
MMSALFMDKGSDGSSGGAFAMRPKFNRNLVGTEDDGKVRNKGFDTVMPRQGLKRA